MASGFFIKGAFMDWEENPVITTMDSIAAPIQGIQFPTVTVCEDDTKPPDNLAPIETILDQFAFECGETVDDQTKWDEEQYKYVTYWPPCNETEELRDKFDFLIETVPLSLARKLREHMRNYTLYDDILNKIALALTEEKLPRKDIVDLSKKYFAVKGDVRSVLDSLINETDETGIYLYYYNYYSNEDESVCNSTKCLQNLEEYRPYVNGLENIMKIQGSIPFGSFLTNFQYMVSDTFCNENCFNYLHDWCEMNNETKSVHDLYVSLSKYFGFKNDTSISLYDVSPIVSSKFDVEYNPSQEFYHYTCQSVESTTLMSVCKTSWIKYTMDPESKNNIINH